MQALLLKLQEERQLEKQLSSQSLSAHGSQKELGGDASSPQKSLVLETLTNILFEALQLLSILPNGETAQLQNEAQDLRQVAQAFENIKNNLIDFKNNVS